MNPQPKWTPFVLADEFTTDPAIPKEVVAAVQQKMRQGSKTYINSRYQVMVTPRPKQGEGWPELVELSIKRRDGAAIHDWRDFQRIKNELVGPEHEAVELYPAESRMVDTANQYYLHVFVDPKVRLPFGFTDRLVFLGGKNGRQRPFENPPPDALNEEQMQTAMRQLQQHIQGAK